MSSLETPAKAQLGLGGTQAQVTGWFQEQLLAALSDPLFNVPKAFETWMVDRVAFSGLNVSAGQIVGLRREAVQIYGKSTAVVDVQNSTTETSVLTDDNNVALVVPGGTLDTSGLIRVTMVFDWLNNTGSNKTSTFKIKWGGSTSYQDVDTAPNNAARRAVRLTLELSAVAATGTQYLSGLWFVANASAPTTGIGSLSFVADRSGPFSSNGTLSVDSTMNQTLDVTVTHPTASVSLSFRRLFYMVEFL